MVSKEEFIVVYEKYVDDIRRYVFYRYGDEEMASEVAQDVFTKVWENRLSLSVNNLNSLLYKMATDYANMNYRKQKYRMNFEQSMMYESSTELSPEDEILYNELIAVYAKTLEQMSEKQRMIYLMSREDGMKYAEIADTLHISIKSVEKHVSAALRLIREKIL